LSTIIALTLDAMSDISLFLKIISGQMYKTLID
jgi:hypothetical protein